MLRIYKAEAEAGLAEALRASARYAFACDLSLAEPFALKRTLPSVAGRAEATNREQPDLHYLKTVLVSTGWNKNEDVFLRDEVWAARHSPEDKPFNYEHDCAQIIGHITDNFVIGSDNKVIADDTVVDDLPGHFHILTYAVLYKSWAKEELQKRMDTLRQEIEEGKWFVSMEALFSNFDYALLTQGGTARVVARNEQTAFLTKHLRIYGGKGVYQDQKVGRVLRNIVFSGKGLVRKPANPESIILSVAEELRPVYGSLKEIPEKSKTMSVELENKELREKVEKLEAQLRDNDVKQVKAQLDAALAEAKDLKDKLANASDRLKAETMKLEEATKAAETAQKAKTDIEGELAKANEQLSSLKAEKVTLQRIALVSDKLKKSDAEAKVFVESLTALSQEQFEQHVTAMQAWVTNNPQSGNTSFSGGKAQEPPKSTNSPTAPKSTSAPTGTKASTDTTILDRVEPKTEPGLAVTTGDGVNAVRKDIHKFFSVKTGDDK
jgi:hypothetical protein